MLQKIKDRQRLKADLGNRKSLASQMRMKSIANLASDSPSSKKRRRGADDDNFGANDEDWGVYRAIAGGGTGVSGGGGGGGGDGDASDDDEDEDIAGGLKSLEADLLQHDPTFTEEHTLSAQSDWSKSLVHAFLRGPWPFDAASAREAHQLHLNVERIRVPEVVFQPGIAGLDQAGLVEIAGDIVTQRLASLSLAPSSSSSSSSPPSFVPEELLRDVFLTGGNTLFHGFDERLRAELPAIAPAGTPLRVRRAADPLLDAWKGAARWAGSREWKRAAITREEYLEKGPEYIKVSNFLSLTLAYSLVTRHLMVFLDRFPPLYSSPSPPTFLSSFPLFSLSS